MEYSNKSWVESGSLTWTLFVLSMSLTTSWVVFSLTLWGTPSFTHFLNAFALGALSGLAVSGVLYGAKRSYAHYLYGNDAFAQNSDPTPQPESLESKENTSSREAILANGKLSANDSRSIDDSSPKIHPFAGGGFPKAHEETGGAPQWVAGPMQRSGDPVKQTEPRFAAMHQSDKKIIANSNLSALSPQHVNGAAALNEYSRAEQGAVSVSQATVEPSHLTLGTPQMWTPNLIKSLEWRVFDRLSVAYWSEQGNKILGIKMDFYRRNKFFVCAAGNKKIRLAVVQSHSSRSAPISKVEMQYLIKIKELSKAKVAILMHSGHLSNVVRSFCINNGIRLLNENNICKGLRALPVELQDQMLDQLVKADYMVPTCPNCRTKMKHRRHKDTGKQVWGCRSYPSCRIMMDYYIV